ncbi:MAG: 23S rRNA pseudouridine(955/2504/2580) synthase RluC [Arenicella sp.]
MYQSVSFVTIDDSNAGQRIDNFLLGKLKGVPKTYIYRIIRKGEVRLNKSRVKASTRLEIGDIVRIPPVRMTEKEGVSAKDVTRHEHLLQRIIYQDEHIMVLNKPTGLAVHAGSGLQFGVIELLRELTQLRFLELVHRLDRETSGCLLLAKKRSALTLLSNAFRTNSAKNNQLDKRYLALVKGAWSVHNESVKQALSKKMTSSGEHRMFVDKDGQYANTIFTSKKLFADAALVEAKLLTGRTHQVRVHAQSQSHPLAGDEKYGDKVFNQAMQSKGLNRLFLHATRLGFTHPHTGEKMTVNAPLAEDLEPVIDALKQPSAAVDNKVGK